MRKGASLYSEYYSGGASELRTGQDRPPMEESRLMQQLNRELVQGQKQQENT